MENIPQSYQAFGLFLIFLLIVAAFCCYLLTRQALLSAGSLPKTISESTVAKSAEEEYVWCMNCEHRVIKDAKFCGWCGFPTDKICPNPNCHQDLTKDVKKDTIRFCTNCKAPVARLEIADLDFEHVDYEDEEE